MDKTSLLENKIRFWSFMSELNPTHCQLWLPTLTEKQTKKKLPLSSLCWLFQLVIFSILASITLANCCTQLTYYNATWKCLLAKPFLIQNCHSQKSQISPFVSPIFHFSKIRYSWIGKKKTLKNVVVFFFFLNLLFQRLKVLFGSSHHKLPNFFFIHLVFL